jgi:hypothetical protein
MEDLFLGKRGRVIVDLNLSFKIDFATSLCVV